MGAQTCHGGILLANVGVERVERVELAFQLLVGGVDALGGLGDFALGG